MKHLSARLWVIRLTGLRLAHIFGGIDRTKNTSVRNGGEGFHPLPPFLFPPLSSQPSNKEKLRGERLYHILAVSDQDC
jgi:hypothetical protein